MFESKIRSNGPQVPTVAKEQKLPVHCKILVRGYVPYRRGDSLIILRRESDIMRQKKWRILTLKTETMGGKQGGHTKQLLAFIIYLV